ncbi:MAG TPA: DUF6599 family protein [Acidisarcina sp.]
MRAWLPAFAGWDCTGSASAPPAKCIQSKRVKAAKSEQVVVSSKIRMHRRTGALAALSALVLLPASIPLATAQSTTAKPVAAAARPAKTTALLPGDFAGWTLSHPPQQSASPATADQTNADVLREDGFASFAAGEYTRDTGKLSIRAMSFVDASGAYAAYTFYRRPGMRPEEIGQGAANDGQHILFWQGTTVVDATFDHLSATYASELRELSQLLPAAAGSAAVEPTLPRYLPVNGIAPVALAPLTTRYSLGPAGYVRSGGALPPSLVGFERGAEVLTAIYSGRDNDGTLTLINYPTPQLAAERQRAIEAFLKTSNPGAATPATAWPQPLADSSPQALLCRRSGPIVAVTSGLLTEVEAHKLIGQVNYLAEVTWNDPKGYNSEISKTGHILLSIVALSAMLCGAALVVGVFLGGGRALYRRLRGKPVSTLNDVEFISLRLEDDYVPPESRQASPHVK